MAIVKSITDANNKETSREVAPVDSNPFIEGPGKNKITLNGKSWPASAKSINNSLVFCMTEAVLENIIVYNEFADDIYFINPPPWEDEQHFRVHNAEEPDVFRFRAWLETRGIIISDTDTWRLLATIAMQNVINPAKDYFDKLEHDHTLRLDKWLSYYLGAEPDETGYLKSVGSKWLIACIARTYEPGCKFDHVLILEGAQGLGKSPAFEALATIGGERYFLDEALEFGNKDSLMKLQGKLIFEMSELASIRRGETEEIKAFLGRQHDFYRPPYARKVVQRKRRFVIGGSVNPNGGYLKDPTGGKRYWPVKCGEIDLEALRRDKEQLWAEAVKRYKAGEQYWLTKEEFEIAKVEQSNRFQEDILSTDIAKAIFEITLESPSNHLLTVSEIAHKMGATTPEKKTYNLSQSIKGYLTSQNYTTCRPREHDGTRPEKWVRAEFKRSTHDGVESNK